MGKSLSCRQTLLLVNDEQFFDEIFRLRPDIAPELISEVVLTFKNDFLQTFQCLCSEWWITAHDDVEDNTTCPQVAFFCVVTLNDLWCHIVGGTKEFVKSLVRLNAARYAEIDELHVDSFARAILVSLRLSNDLLNKDIFYFQISVDDSA